MGGDAALTFGKTKPQKFAAAHGDMRHVPNTSRKWREFAHLLLLQVAFFFRKPVLTSALPRHRLSRRMIVFVLFQVRLTPGSRRRASHRGTDRISSFANRLLQLQPQSLVGGRFFGVSINPRLKRRSRGEMVHTGARSQLLCGDVHIILDLRFGVVPSERTIGRRCKFP